MIRYNGNKEQIFQYRIMRSCPMRNFRRDDNMPCSGERPCAVGARIPCRLSVLFLARPLVFPPEKLAPTDENCPTDLQGGLLGGSIGLDVHTQRPILSFRLAI